jgi:DNA-binding MarR family transcriptional regulator
MPKQPDPSVRVLEELGRVIRHLTRLSGGPDEGPALTSTQRLGLFELLEDGPMRLNDLAVRMGTSPPTASRAVDALAEAGLVVRLTDPDDRRALRIELTPDGRARVDLRKEQVADAFRPAAAGMPVEERERLAVLLARLAGELSRTDPSGPRPKD